VQFIRSLIAAGALIVSAAAIAPAQQPSGPPAPVGRRAVKAAKHARAKRRQHVHKALLRGITLSDAEKANMKSVHEKYAPQVQAIRTQVRTQAQNARSARQRGDTAAIQSIRASVATQRAQVQALRRAEQTDIRGALTPANQATFDANLKRVQNRQAKQTLRGRKVSQP
jgi:LTXXQ motif family protein